MQLYQFLTIGLFLFSLHSYTMDQSLTKAIDEINYQEVNQLLEKGATITNSDNIGNNYVFQLLTHIPYKSEHAQILEKLLAHQDGHSLINKKGKLDSSEMTNLELLFKGLDLGKTENDMKSFITMIRLLIKHGEDPYNAHIIKIANVHGLGELAVYMSKKRSEFQSSRVAHYNNNSATSLDENTEITILTHYLKNHFSNQKQLKSPSQKLPQKKRKHCTIQ